MDTKGWRLDLIKKKLLKGAEMRLNLRTKCPFPRKLGKNITFCPKAFWFQVVQSHNKESFKRKKEKKKLFPLP